MNPTVLTLIRGIHDLFSALWVGGLLLLALVILPVALRQGGMALAFHIQDRLRKFLWVAIVVLAVTGILLARMRETGGSLVSTPGPYRTLFGLKLLTVGLMVAVAALRQFLMFRRKVKNKAPAVLLMINVLLAVVTILLSAALPVVAGVVQRPPL